MCRLSPPSWFARIVVKSCRLAGYPFDKSCDLRVLFERSPSAVVFAEFTLAQSRVDLAVANFMDQFFGFAAAAFGLQVMFINAQTRQHRPAAQRAVGQKQGFDVAERLSAAQMAF